MHQRNSVASVSSAPSLEGGRDLEVVLGHLARHRVDDDVGERAVAHEDPLDLEAGDVLAAPAEVVGLAVDEEQVVVLVDPTDVAGVVPPVAAGLDGGLGPAPVALEHDVGPLRPHDDLAVGAAGQLVVVVVEDADVEVLVVDDAGRVGLVADAGRLPRDQAGLGDAVGAAEGVDRRTASLRRRRSRPAAARRR